MIKPHFVRKGCAGRVQIAILPQFLAIEPHFYQNAFEMQRFSKLQLSDCQRERPTGQRDRDNGTTGTRQRDNGNGTTGRAVPNPSSDIGGSSGSQPSQPLYLHRKNTKARLHQVVSGIPWSRQWWSWCQPRTWEVPTSSTESGATVHASFLAMNRYKWEIFGNDIYNENITLVIGVIIPFITGYRLEIIGPQHNCTYIK